jgi:WD40 repeat protein
VDAALANPDTPALVLLEGHTSGVTAVAFNGEGTLLASTSYDGTIRLWGVRDSE